MKEALDWVRRDADGCLLDVDTTLYDAGAVMRAAYRFTDRLYVFISRVDERVLRMHIATKDASDAMEWAGHLSNALIDEQLRVSIAAETRAVRELIYLQAFAEADFNEDAS